jgi:glycerol-3-phosphate acyltransferase PlsY
MWLLTISIIATAYLLGSLPSVILPGRLSGVDVGNTAAATSEQQRPPHLGKGWGFAVFFVDALKGSSPCDWR